MNKIDVHFHTTLSDGSRHNNEVIKEAKSKGLKFISATEHDIINDELILNARINGMNTTGGVEISANEDITGKSLHMTCYSDNFGKEIRDILENTREKRKLKIRKQIDILKSNGFNIDYDKFIRYYKNLNFNVDNLNNLNIEDYVFQNEKNINKLLLSLAGVKLERGEFIARCLKKGGDLNFIGWGEIEKYEPSVSKIGELAQSNKYFLSVAHPNFTFSNNKQGFLDFVEEYHDKINGLEINAMASKEWTDLIIETSIKYALILTFGSDSHHKGVDARHGDLGDMNKYISNEIIEENFENFLYEISKGRK